MCSVPSGRKRRRKRGRFCGGPATKRKNIVKELSRMNKGVRKGPTARAKLNTLRNETYSAIDDSTGAEQEALPPIDPGHVFKKGDMVRITTLNTDGQILEAPRDGTVAVQIGVMRATLPVEQLRPIARTEAKGTERKAPRQPASPSSGANEIAMRKTLQIAPELMLRAMRVEEAEPLLDKYVDDAFAAGMSQARIIHGKGTGTLRRVVHAFLNDHPAVASYRVGTGKRRRRRRNGRDVQNVSGLKIITPTLCLQKQTSCAFDRRAQDVLVRGRISLRRQPPCRVC